MRSLSFVFVIDGPALELQGLLLVPRLRAMNTGDRIIAYRPRGAADLSSVTEAVFAASGVETHALRSEGSDIWAKPYPHGNKILACAEPREEACTVFLDTDMVAARSFGDAGLPGSGEVAVVPEGVPSWGREGDRWERAYAHFGLPMPDERVRLTRRKRRAFLPYFNAGLVAFRSRDGFAEAWLETAREIDHGLRVGGKRPWLDQIALPIALRRAGLSYKMLNAVWNFSISDRAHEPDADPVMVHYHRFGFLADWPQGGAAWDALRRVLPAGTETDVAASLAAAGFRTTASGSSAG